MDINFTLSGFKLLLLLWPLLLLLATATMTTLNYLQAWLLTTLTVYLRLKPRLLVAATTCDGYFDYFWLWQWQFVTSNVTTRDFWLFTATTTYKVKYWQIRLVATATKATCDCNFDNLQLCFSPTATAYVCKYLRLRQLAIATNATAKMNATRPLVRLLAILAIYNCNYLRLQVWKLLATRATTMSVTATASVTVNTTVSSAITT